MVIDGTRRQAQIVTPEGTEDVPSHQSLQAILERMGINQPPEKTNDVDFSLSLIGIRPPPKPKPEPRAGEVTDAALVGRIVRSFVVIGANGAFVKELSDKIGHDVTGKWVRSVQFPDSETQGEFFELLEDSEWQAKLKKLIRIAGRMTFKLDKE